MNFSHCFDCMLSVMPLLISLFDMSSSTFQKGITGSNGSIFSHSNQLSLPPHTHTDYNVAVGSERNEQLGGTF